MKYVFQILWHGFQNPRHFIQSLNLNWKQVVGLMAIIVMVLASGGLMQAKPAIDSIGEEFAMASQYVPEFTNQMGVISLQDGEKPLYYQSSNFQLVVDDSIVAESNLTSVPLTDEQRESINTTTPFNLFIFKNISFLSALGIMRPIPNQWPFLLNNTNLNVLLNFYNNNTWRVLIPVFISLFFSHLLIYTIEIAIMALILGLYNLRLSQPLTFGQRFKMAITVSALPFIGLQILFLFFPLGNIYTWATLVSIVIVYFVFQNHTRFVHDLQNAVNQFNKSVKNDENQSSDNLSPQQILILLAKLVENGEIDKNELGTGETIDIDELKDKYKKELDDIAKKEQEKADKEDKKK